MSLMFRIALFSAMTMVVACKADKPAGKKPDEATRVADPSKAPDPVKPADPAVKPPEPPAEPAQGLGKNTELQDKGIAMMQRMADMFVADAKDCDKLAADIKKLVADNKSLLVALNAEAAKQTDQERTLFEARNKATQDAVNAKMTPVGQACASNKNFLDALKSPTE